VLRVRDQLQHIDGTPTFTPPKSKRSKRDIPLDADTVAVLRAQLARVDARRDDDEAQWQRPDFGNLVFPSEVGTPIGTSNLLRSFRAALKRTGLRTDLRFHDLRHTAGSLMLAAGAQLVDVSRLLGHSSTAVTDRIYAHSYEDTRRDAVASVASRLRRA
jgi:integrase